MKNIHVLPTDKPSRVYSYNGVLGLAKSFQHGSEVILNQNIYITNDEEIKDLKLHKGKWHLEKAYILNKFPNYLTDLSECKLIILTTDQDLIKDGVQAIDDKFLEWFVKNPSCEFAHLGFTSIIGDSETKRTYKIIIPKEEPKQETLEEVAERFLSKELLDLSDWDKRHILKAMVNMSKWQQQQNKNLYSEEEVLEHLNHLILMPSSELDKFTDEEEMVTMKWFNQNKKK